MGGDFFADGLRPDGARQLFAAERPAGQFQPPDELAGAFHVGWSVHFIIVGRAALHVLRGLSGGTSLNDRSLAVAAR
jgi:hypothetical protein